MTCSTCKLNIEEEVGWGGSTSNCQHLFCYMCIENKVKSSNGRNIYCSAENPDGTICKASFTAKEIESFVDEKVFEDYCSRSGLNGQEAAKNEEAGPSSWSNLAVASSRTLAEVEKVPSLIFKYFLGIFSQNKDGAGPSNQSNARLADASSRSLTEEEKQTSWGQVAETIKQLMVKGYSYTKAMEIVDKMPVWKTNREIACILCGEDNVPIGQGVILKDCLHSFCRECLGRHIHFADGQAEVSCPFVEDDYRCDSFLKPKELKALSSKEEYLKHYEEFSVRDLEKIPNAYNCRTPNCGYICIVDQDATGASAIQFKCPKCRKRNCTKCKVIHESGCQEYRQRLEDEEKERQRIARELQEREDQEKRDRLNRLEQQRLERLSEAEIQAGLDTGTYEKCPKCSYLCHKYTGCNHVVCGKCKRKFNWGVVKK